MAKQNMNALLKSRMASTKQASELAASDEAYERIFRESAPTPATTVADLPLDLLDPFSTADIGFRPYPPQKLEAFAEQLKEEGLMVRIIVRPRANGRYEILAEHNRVGAARLAGWSTIAAEIVEADDVRAIVIATSTNLIQRQQLSIVERGKAYKALLDAKNRQGQWYIGADSQTSGENRQRYLARALVAEFFGVTEYEIRKLVKLTNLVPELLDVLEDNTRRLGLASAEIIADYDRETQLVFVEICVEYGKQLNKAAMQYIAQKCPPPKADRQEVFQAWREAEAVAETCRNAPPKNITFFRKVFAPYLDKLGSEAELERLFLAFLKERVSIYP